jgi:hypothetical protein
MDITEAEIDEMSEGDEIDKLLSECRFYDGEGSPSSDEELAYEILYSEVPMFGKGSIENFTHKVAENTEGRYEAEISNSEYSIQAEAESEALVITKILAKYCVSKQ